MIMIYLILIIIDRFEHGYNIVLNNEALIWSGRIVEGKRMKRTTHADHLFVL